MRLAITLNCQPGPQAIVYGKKTAREMWTTLEAQYKGSGTTLMYNAIVQYTNLKYNDYTSLEKFIVAFRQSIDKLKTLKIEPPESWHPILFNHRLEESWPSWAERPRSLSRNEKSALTLNQLIEDITDEARNKEKKPEGSAMYSN